MMKTRWIIVADTTRCRIFTQEKRFGPLVTLDERIHPAARLPEREHVTDRPGRSFDSAGSGRHAMEPPSDVREQEAEKFAAEIADLVGKARAQDSLDALVLIVEPRFLGHLRARLDPQSLSLVELEIAANLAKASAEQILEKIKSEF